MTLPNKHQSRTVGQLLNCQAASFSVEQSFSMHRKQTVDKNDHHFSPDNVWKYLALDVNKSLE